MAEVTLDTTRIHDWYSFHRVSAETSGFPDFYGQNMNAWIDCLTYIREGDGMSSFVLGDSEQLSINLPDFEVFTGRVPDISAELLLCISFINQRSLERGQKPALVLLLL
ncbi:barstar family protein [Deinococcus radiomollis]|uniref:barstar family protein n=1 Tax=Deinococcus radiomollis TaxID=468916 RepID=UPI00389198B4